MMDGGALTPGPAMPLGLTEGALDGLMPMYLWLTPEGRVQGMGATLRKVLGEAAIHGRDLFDLFDLRRPGGLDDMAALRAAAGRRLYLVARDDPQASFRAVAVALAGGGLLFNLSFGIGIVDAVRRHALTEADFAATDLAVEMLYLVEAKSAVMEALRQLNLRLHGAKTEAEEQALTDTLTGLRNRRGFDLALERALAGGGAFALMHLDLDFFKQVNDTRGHAAGDLVLQTVAQVLRQETRAGDTLARVGGDEFMALLPGLTACARLGQIATGIIAGVRRPVPYQGADCQVSASIGLVIHPGDGAGQGRCSGLGPHGTPPDAARIVEHTDAALYAAKRAGRGQAFLYGANGPEPCG